jgi:hypothetical protein
MKKLRRDKTFGIIIHIYMEISQGNLCSYLYLKQKCHIYLFISFLLQSWKTGRWKKSCPDGSADTQLEEVVMGKGLGQVG